MMRASIGPQTKITIPDCIITTNAGSFWPSAGNANFNLIIVLQPLLLSKITGYSKDRLLESGLVLMSLRRKIIRVTALTKSSYRFRSLLLLRQLFFCKTIPNSV